MHRSLTKNAISDGCGTLDGIGLDWISLDGARYRAPCGAKNGSLQFNPWPGTKSLQEVVPYHLQNGI